ncbi:hypothetical protein C8J57DRAFT_1540855 [Mycena rebaudengoi]|nr:hypothetical protein C8J57DRAFT_1540855 [Mycena rebaudengoi]
MDLIPTTRPPQPDSEEGNWEWNEKFVKISGTSTIFDVEGRLLQLLNPAVLPTTRTSQGGSTYHFKTVELVAIAASLGLSDQDIKRHPEFRVRMFLGLSMKAPHKIVKHMAIHILFDTNPPIDPDDDVCGFCLSTGGHCSLRLVKRKGKDGSQRTGIDLEQSRCPNVANLGLGNAGKFSENRPCTNVPSHIQRIHTGANVVAYKSYYDKHPSEKVGLKRISKTKTRTRGKKAITFRISEQHSTQSALGNSFSNAKLGEDVDNNMDEDDPGDQADDDDDNQADNDCSSDFPSRLAEDSDEEMEFSEPPTSEQAPILSDDPSMVYGDSALNVPRSSGHVSYGRVSSFPPDLGGRNGRDGHDLETQTSALAQDQYPQFGNQTAPPGTPAIRAMIPVHAAATRPKPRPLFKTTTAATSEQAASDPSEDAPPARSIDKLSNMLTPVLCDPIPLTKKTTLRNEYDTFYLRKERDNRPFSLMTRETAMTLTAQKLRAKQ